MRVAIAAILISAVGGSPRCALADWQYTHWGMTPDQVVLASKGSVHLAGGTPRERVLGGDLGAEGSYSADSYDFKAQFFFDVAHRLQVVKLLLSDNSHCDQLLSDMTSLYGIGSNTIAGKKWIDTEKGNRVGFTESFMNAPCFVFYEPLVRSGGGGL